MTPHTFPSVTDHAAAAEFVRSGRVIVRFPGTETVADLVECFRDFLAESEEFRRTWRFDLENGADDPDDGYIRRAAEYNPTRQWHYDRKHMFMYRPLLPVLLRDHGVVLDGHQRFLDRCEELYIRCRTTVVHFARTVDALVPEYGILREIEAGADQDKVRLNVYDPGIPRGEVAKEHTDRAALTIHLWESRPGMRFPDGTLYVALPGTALIFAGQKMNRLTGGRIAKLPHRVTEERDDGDSRASAVYFAHIPGRSEESEPTA